ncbi:PadR family transcriptional regulator [Metallosphaera tengchongensis]|uniref:PadR family transcriptional regulator n=1 Tax=Metallosphaera tengchongensis TaxID=1532350 RepID=A0A6N0NZU0_9CREN|nr:PadR family transcriptional regulator [Metallosphaera tengchongensis]QKR00878.1 PadR family transcriptional regulator [Metallosphaera tengchongensis]
MNWVHGHHGFRSRHRRGLRFLILTSLREGPKNGVEIMRSIEKGMGWVPSPGSLYPMLARMTEEGLIRNRGDGKYELTDEGKEWIDSVIGRLNWVPAGGEDVGEQIEFLVEYLEDLKKSEPEGFEKMRGKLKEVAKRLDELVSK